MSKLRKSPAMLLLLAAAGIFTLIPILGFQGNNAGTVTFSVRVFNAVTSAQASASVQNNNQAAHWLNYCTNGSATGISIELEASFDNSTYFAISPAATDTGCGVVEAGGYFPYVRANLITLTGAGANVTAYYSGSSSPIASGGASQRNKTPQITTIFPATMTASNAINTGTVIDFSVSPYSTVITLYRVSVYNPNASDVFLQIWSGTGATGTLYYIARIPASDSRDFSFEPAGVGNCAPGAGLGCQPGLVMSPSIACSSSYNTKANPATACQVSAIYRPLPGTNVSVQGGTIVKQPSY